MDLNLQIRRAYQQASESREYAAIEKIKSNPKFFYSYARSHSVVRSDIAMVRDEEGRMLVEPQLIANALQDHFSSVYSDPNCEEVQAPLFESPQIQSQMEIDFTAEDVEEAIRELRNGSAPGADGVPTVLLKSCSQVLAGPLASMWKWSLRVGVVPDF